MPEFKSVDELLKYMKDHPEEVINHLEEDHLTLPCPVCESDQKMKNLRNGKVQCLNCNNEIKLEPTIEIK